MAAPDESLEEVQQRVKAEIFKKRMEELQKQGQVAPPQAPISMKDIAKTEVEHFRQNPFLNLKMARPDEFVKQLKKKEKKQPMLMAMLEYQHASIEMLTHLINVVSDFHLSVVALIEILKGTPTEEPTEDVESAPE